ncbi:MAG: asparagine synthetase B family protein, partial [Candidatus Thorarchaeota archaeon]
KKINGMFSFAIWDSNQNMLTLARDKFGIKPLYYTIIDNNLIFSSELKGILQFNSHKWKINPIAIHSYFCLSYIPNPFTIFQNIHKLPPGCLFIWTKSKSHTIQYIDIEQNFISLNEKEYEKSFTQLLINSIKSRISENWPIGIFLSGGIDSSTLAALLSQLSTKTINAYAMGFHDTTQRFCEIEYARQISENYNINLIESYLDPELFISSLSNYINFIDEPFGDYAIFPTFVLSKKANSLSKIIFSGEGSDELLNGYPIHIRKFKTSQNNKTLSSYYGVRNRFNESDLFKNYNG